MFADDILCIENPEDSKKTVKLINEFSKVAGHKINIQKSVVSIYSFNNKTPKKDIKVTIPFTIAS